jgi:hypothetical protein
LERNKIVAEVPPQNPSANPSIPLSPDARAAYQALYDKLQAAQQANRFNLDAIQLLNQWQPQVEQVLVQDYEYKLSQDTNIFAALEKQVDSVNVGLEALRVQVQAIASHFAMAGDVIAAIDKVLGFFIPGA